MARPFHDAAGARSLTVRFDKAQGLRYQLASTMPLTPEAASHICLHECKARCCWGPQFLRLTAAEVPPFKARAAALGVTARVRDEPDGGGSVRYLEHEGERCPMLDGATWKCRIYADRPQRCREFPDRPRPGCAISEL